MYLTALFLCRPLFPLTSVGFVIWHHFWTLFERFTVCHAVAPAMPREQNDKKKKKRVLSSDYSNHQVLSGSLRSGNFFDTFCPPNTQNNPDVATYNTSVTFLHRHVAL